MNHVKRSLIYCGLFLISQSYASEVSKKILGGVYIYDGDEPCVSTLEIRISLPSKRFDNKYEK